MLQVSGVIGYFATFSLIENANITMYCNDTLSCLPSKRTSLEEMCASVTELTSSLSTGDTVTGMCNVSEDCLDVNCSLQVAVRGSSLPVTLSVTLLPCQCPFAIYVKAETMILFRTFTIIDGTYSRNETIDVTLCELSGRLYIHITQIDCGIVLSVSSYIV